MSLGNSAENNLMLLLFQNVNWAVVGDAVGIRGSTVAGSFFITLATADQGEAGTQLTSETAYGAYARVAVARSAAGWTVSGTAPTQAANAAIITFATAISGPSTISHFAIGRETSGAGENLWYGAVTTPLVVNTGVAPTIAIGALIATMD